MGKKGKKQKVSGDERRKKTSKIRGTKNQRTRGKNLNGGEEKRKQKEGFHQMATKFVHTS